MKKNRVLLVGTSFSAAPLLHALRRMGYHVAVCGAKPSDPCVAYADEYHCIDYSDKDALLELVRAESFAYLCPSCNDYAYLAASHVASNLGLPGYDDGDTVAIIHNKAAFRAFMEKHGLPSPRARRTAPGEALDASALRLPLLVKPVDSFSGRGVSKVDRLSAIEEAVQLARQESRSSEALVEEFVGGTLHSHSAFISGGQIHEDFFVDEFCQVYPYQVDCSNSPSRLGGGIQAQVRDCISEMARLLHLQDGLLHTQFMVDGSRFYIIECMRRCPGDLYYNLVEFSTGADYVGNYVAPFVGRPFAAPQVRPATCWARHTLSLPDDAVFWSFEHRIPSSQVRIFPLCESGSLVAKAPYGKIAILFARFENPKSLFECTPKIGDLLSIHVTELAHAAH